MSREKPQDVGVAPCTFERQPVKSIEVLKAKSQPYQEKFSCLAVNREFLANSCTLPKLKISG
jgi:hypothetical protein